MFENILKDHPDLFEKIKEICVITDTDMEHIAHESIPVSFTTLTLYRAKRTSKKRLT